MYIYIHVFVCSQLRLDGLNMEPTCRSKILELAINLALDRHDPQRELTSQLIADLHGNALSRADIGQGFDELLNNLSDLTLDTPEAPTVTQITRYIKHSLIHVVSSTFLFCFGGW